MPPPRLTLTDLVDLELQLQADLDADPRALSERDRRIGLDAAPLPDARAALVQRWLQGLRAARGRDGASVGRSLERGYRAAAWVLGAVMLAAGASAVAGVLQYSGEHPINVVTVIGVLVLPQIVIVSVTLLSLLLLSRARSSVAGHRGDAPAPGLLRGLVQRLGQRLARLQLPLDDARAADLQRLRGWMRGRRTLYGAVEQQLAVLVLQIGAIAFNVGALGCLLLLVTFSDLAFGWNTTLRLDAHQVHALTDVLCAPFRWVTPGACPTEHLVQATRYSRLEGAYIGATAGGRVTDAAAVGGWWPFVAMSLFVYGLLPRVLVLALSAVGLRRALARVPLDTPDLDAVERRMRAPALRRAHGPDPGNVAPLGHGAGAVPPPRPVQGGAGALCVAWRDARFDAGALDTLLASRFDATRRGPVGAAGGADYADDEALYDRVAALSDPKAPVFVIVEPWTPPDRAFRRLLDAIRARGGAARTINVLLTAGAGPAEVDIWAGYLAELGDIYLALEREVSVPAAVSA
ncbi:MAG: DUF2868 domain-containing protein [Myxococcales bacterium]|nr:DUF2868 domain-containing protein [Myxococcales bacterium]